MNRVRGVAALLSLVAMLIPLELGASVTFHLTVVHGSHHHAGDAGAARDLEAIWHGHSHDKATPEHEHLGIAAQAPGSRVSAVQLSAPTLVQFVDFAAWRFGAERQLVRAFAVGRSGVDPPSSPERQTILRI